MNFPAANPNVEVKLTSPEVTLLKIGLLMIWLLFTGSVPLLLIETKRGWLRMSNGPSSKKLGHLKDILVW